MKIDADDRIGLGPDSWWATVIDFPTQGFDSYIADLGIEVDGVLSASGHSREEWLELADEMIRRWTAWRAYVLALPDVTNVEEGR